MENESDTDSQQERQQLSERMRRASFSNRLPILLAIGFYLLLVDLAIETFLTPSSIRWLVLGAVVAFGAATYVFWRRLAWHAKATFAALVFFSLLAITAWWPLGLVQGVRLLGQSTSTLFSLLTLLAVILAGFVVYRASTQPWIRVLAIILAAYSAMAFGLALTSGSPYAELFRGSAFWRKLPFWLQGSFIGTVLLIPLALLTLLAKLIWVPRERRSFSLPQAVALILALSLAAAAWRGPAGFSAETGSAETASEQLDQAFWNISGATTRPTGGPSRDRNLTIMEKSFTQIESMLGRLPRETFDMSAVVQKIGPDPTALLRWVREETSLVPYKGTLRGHLGVLLDRFGNSLDRALLLHEFLRLAGHEVRLAHSTISIAEADRILNDIRAQGAGTNQPRDVPSEPAAQALVDELATKFQIDRAQLDSQIKRFDEEKRSVTDGITRRVAEQSETIRNLVGPSRSQGNAQMAREALRDHWWVQVHRASEWLDMDPTIQRGEIGQKIVEAQETFLPSQLAASVHHEVEIRVVVERMAAGVLTEQVALQAVFRPIDLYGSEVELRIVPGNPPATFDFLMQADRHRIFRETLLSTKDWIVVLKVGQRIIGMSSFTDSGEVIKNPSQFGRGVGELGGDVGRILGGHQRRGEEPRRDEKDTFLTSVWLDYEIRSPGRPSIRNRREVFDLIGMDARNGKRFSQLRLSEEDRLRRSFALLSRIHILVLGSRLSNEFVRNVVGQRMLSNRSLLLELFRKDKPTLVDFAKASNEIHPVPVPLYAFALARHAWSRLPNAVYLDVPNIVALKSLKVRQDSSGDAEIWNELDIVANEVAVHPRDEKNLFIVRLEQGVLDTNAEAFIMASDGEVENASEVLARSLAQNVEWRVITDPRQLGSLALSADVRARMAESLGSGHIIVAPRKPISINGRPVVAWWRVEPRGGQTLGIGKDGSGQSATEQALWTGLAVFAASAIGCQLVAGTDCDGLTHDDVKMCFLFSLTAGIAGFGGMFVAVVGGTSVAALEASFVFGAIGSFGLSVYEGATYRSPRSDCPPSSTSGGTPSPNPPPPPFRNSGPYQCQRPFRCH